MLGKRLLVIDDDVHIITSLKYLLESDGYEIVGSGDPTLAIEKLNKEKIDLVFVDMNFKQDTTSGQEGLALVRKIRDLDPYLPIVSITGWATLELVVEVMKVGANDFIEKPWDDGRLLSIVEIQLKLAKTEVKLEQARRQNQLLTEQQGFNQNIIAESPAMLQVLDELNELAQSDMSVLLTGSNGTGKTMLASCLHNASNRKKNAFVTVNLGAIPEQLFESEMFGHEKGAFTDAKEKRVGRVEVAQGGSLFLDELLNLPLVQQAKLLRVIEERSFERVGSNKSRHADVRWITATNGDILEHIKRGDFRQDLYYRLNTIEIRIPSLKERIEDIEPLANSFLGKFCKKYNKGNITFTREAIDVLVNYIWPGNVRELDHVIERSVYCCNSNYIEAADLSIRSSKKNSQHHEKADVILSNTLTLQEIEQAVLENRLRFHNGNTTKAAESLGLSRSGWYRRQGKYVD